MCGKKQCGKNSLCNFFKELLPEYKITEFAFAKALKDLAIKGFGIPAKSCYGSDADKNYPVATWGKFFTQQILDKYNKQSDTLLSGREFLQLLGTDIMRHGRTDLMAVCPDNIYIINSWLQQKFGSNWKLPFDFKNIWANVVVEDIKRAQEQFDIITVSDVRFFNEIDALKSVDARLIRLYRDAGTTDSIPHPSELEMELMDDDLFDYILDNLTKIDNRCL